MERFLVVRTNFKNEKDGELREVYITQSAIAAVEDIIDHDCANIILKSGKAILAMSTSASAIIKELKKPIKLKELK